jgi:hypothetical protein
MFCLTQLVIFYNMAHALAGYPGEGRVFEPNPMLRCFKGQGMAGTNYVDVVEATEEHQYCRPLATEAGLPVYEAPYVVSSDITDILLLLETESKNAESYSELGKQLIETIMRTRQILIYFMMQVRRNPRYLK